MAVLELDSCPPSALSDEANLDLARSLEVRLDLPLWADVPADYNSMRRLVSEDPRPTALATIDAAVIDVTAHARPEHRLGDLDGKQIVLARLDAIEFLREDAERPLDRRIYDNLRVNARGIGFPDHLISSYGCIISASSSPSLPPVV